MNPSAEPAPSINERQSSASALALVTPNDTQAAAEFLGAAEAGAVAALAVQRSLAQLRLRGDGGS